MTIRQVNAELGEPTAQMTKGNRTVNFYSSGQRLNFINGILDSIEGYEFTKSAPAPQPVASKPKPKPKPQNRGDQSTAVAATAETGTGTSANQANFSFTDSGVSGKQMVYYLSGGACGLLIVIFLIRQFSDEQN